MLRYALLLAVALGRPCGHGRRRRAGLHAAGGHEEISRRAALVV